MLCTTLCILHLYNFNTFHHVLGKEFFSSFYFESEISRWSEFDSTEYWKAKLVQMNLEFYVQDKKWWYKFGRLIEMNDAQTFSWTNRTMGTGVPDPYFPTCCWLVVTEGRTRCRASDHPCSQWRRTLCSPVILVSRLSWADKLTWTQVLRTSCRIFLQGSNFIFYDFLLSSIYELLPIFYRTKVIIWFLESISLNHIWCSAFHSVL